MALPDIVKGAVISQLDEIIQNLDELSQAVEFKFLDTDTASNVNLITFS